MLSHWLNICEKLLVAKQTLSKKLAEKSFKILIATTDVLYWKSNKIIHQCLKSLIVWNDFLFALLNVNFGLIQVYFWFQHVAVLDFKTLDFQIYSKFHSTAILDFRLSSLFKIPAFCYLNSTLDFQVCLESQWCCSERSWWSIFRVCLLTKKFGKAMNRKKYRKTSNFGQEYVRWTSTFFVSLCSFCFIPESDVGFNCSLENHPLLPKMTLKITWINILLKSLTLTYFNILHVRNCYIAIYIALLLHTFILMTFIKFFKFLGTWLYYLAYTINYLRYSNVFLLSLHNGKWKIMVYGITNYSKCILFSTPEVFSRFKFEKFEIWIRFWSFFFF